MPYLNSVTLMGNLAQDPVKRFSPSGKPIAQFTVTVNIRDRESGESHGEFFPCEVWGGWAENLCKTAFCLILCDRKPPEGSLTSSFFSIMPLKYLAILA